MINPSDGVHHFVQTSVFFVLYLPRCRFLAVGLQATHRRLTSKTLLLA